MSCCNQCQAIEDTFNQETAEGDLAHYHRHGPSRQTKLLLESLRTLGVNGLTLLDIGGGVGVIQHELFKAGIREAIDVDASRAYMNTARKESERQGNAERVRFYHGDFVQIAEQIEPADIVTLDRVICCYPDMPVLVSLSAQRARKFYAFVYPRDSWWTRPLGRLGNGFLWLTRDKFRFFIHPIREVDSILRANGFRPHLQRSAGLIWQVAIYIR
ncbi:MAG: class I SAM-dependent methyltransferase [Anaerolineae bacterium]|nr:class I SAM-dependent methyltransferase [Anaerolineae bacterium]